MEKSMKKIGIVTCLNSNNVCTRAGCLKAFRERTDFFAEYGLNTELAVLMTCNGCRNYNPAEPEEDPGMREKVQRLKQEKIEAVHVGVCRMQKGGECPRMMAVCRMIEAQGIPVIRGTHKE